MRSLYWKIFLSFWLATILIIITTAWIISEITQKSSIPASERVFMDSYANAAVATFESGRREALEKWLQQTGTARQMTLYLLISNGEIISVQPPPDIVKEIAANLTQEKLDDGLLKFGDIIVSHEILSTSGNAYRLVAVSEKPLAHFVEIPWASLSIRIIIAIVISGLICYLLSIYLTKPLRSLKMAAKSIARGKLNTRVGPFIGHYRDELYELTGEFNRMAEELEALINSKERLLQDISHELRSPLARLLVAIELGRKKTNNHAEPEFARMELECIRLNKLISEILEFTRLDKAATPLSKVSLNLNDLILQIIDDAHFEINNEHAHLKLVADKIYSIQANERLIHRAFENIIRNALHYSMPSPEITIFLNHSTLDESIDIDIQDNGPGVPDQQLETIFNPFYRVDWSREKKTGGYGLGLAIASQAIHLHKGNIKAVNRTDHSGLIIKINLPVKLEM